MGGGGVFKPDWRMVAGRVKCPGWAVSMLSNNLPRFAKDTVRVTPEGTINIPSMKKVLGIGDDGHTASLFPDTPVLHVEDRIAKRDRRCALPGGQGGT